MTVAATLTDAVEKPEHVPDSAVYDFDLFYDPGLVADPHRRVLDLVENAPPVFWTPRNGGHWMIMSHGANFEAARDTETFSNEMIPHDQLEAMLAQMPPDAPLIPVAYPINLDPPLHGKYRLPLQGVFSPRTINSLKDSIRALAGEILDGVAGDEGCEFMAAVAEPLPVKVFLNMLGLPLDKLPEYRALVKAHLSEIQPDPTKAVQRLQAVAAAMRDTDPELSKKGFPSPKSQAIGIA